MVMDVVIIHSRRHLLLSEEYGMLLNFVLCASVLSTYVLDKKYVRNQHKERTANMMRLNHF